MGSRYWLDVHCPTPRGRHAIAPGRDKESRPWRGQVLKLDVPRLKHLTLMIGDRKAFTDATGRSSPIFSCVTALIDDLGNTANLPPHFGLRSGRGRKQTSQTFSLHHLDDTVGIRFSASKFLHYDN